MFPAVIITMAPKEFFQRLFSKKTRNRIWELDAFRGLCILFVIAFHVMYDLEYLDFGFQTPHILTYVRDYGGVLFIILSGICITLGHHNIARGLVVALSAAAVTGATLLMGDEQNYIFFGVLHLLAFCMLTYSLYRKLPWQAILAIGVTIIGFGIYFEQITVQASYLFPLGLIRIDFIAGDFFPIFPHLGWFMVGVVLGKTLYKKKETLFGKVDPDFFLIRFFAFCGRHSLLIYLLHQPVAYALIYLIGFLIRRN